MHIAISGYCDKRALIYPLLKFLQPLGSTLLITDNTCCQRLVDDNRSLGHFMNVLVVVTSLTSDEVFEELGYKITDFDNIIYDVKNYFPENIDIKYGLFGEKVEPEEADFAEEFGPYTTKWLLSALNKKIPGYVTIPFSQQLCTYIEQVENFKALPPTVTDADVKRLSKDLMPKSNLPEKTIQTMLKARWVY